MKKTLIVIALCSQALLAEFSWGMNPESENRLNVALKLNHKAKISVQNQAVEDFVTVGEDGACDFRVGANKIQNAIDSGSAEIRIASNSTYEENVVIDNTLIDILIRGGFTDCTQANNGIQSDAIEDWTVVTRATGSVTSVFSIRDLPSGITTSFENLKIIGGDSQSQGSGGSVSFKETNSDGIFNNVWMTGAYQSFTGGGLSVVSSNTTVLLNNTDIFNNRVADNGGGIYCNNFSDEYRDGSIVLSESSNLYANYAGNSGGGALIGKDCFFASFSGSATVNGGKGIFDNTAVNHGGGISAFGSGDVHIDGHVICAWLDGCLGNATDPASVYGNTANTLGVNRNGGAINASGPGTSITIVAGHIYDNTISPGLTSFGAGGAVSLTNGAALSIQYPDPENSEFDCWSTDRCNMFSDNSAHLGGVIYTNDAQVGITSAYFEDNRANAGTVAYLSGNENVVIRNGVFNNNGDNGNGAFHDQYLIQAFGPTIDLAYSTIADNKSEAGVFYISAPASTLNLQSSIIHDPESGSVINESSGTINSNCVMAHELSSFSGTDNALDDPEFVDRAKRDYHLDNSKSPAIDYCRFFATNFNRDIEFQERGFDDPNLSNFLGPYDIGADEAIAIELVFEDGFE